MTDQSSRWSMYDPVLRAADVCSILDLGCNLGVHTARYASEGYIALGVDVDRRLISRARRRHALVSGCGFMSLGLTPTTVQTLPVFDAVLLLSVHHRWVYEYGLDQAGAMVAEVAKRASRVMLFEAAARGDRYGENRPRFIDNEEASVTGATQAFLSHHLPSHSVTLLGKAPLGSSREPYRWSWAIWPEGSTPTEVSG